jgi:hypothetical protein
MGQKIAKLTLLILPGILYWSDQGLMLLLFKGYKPFSHLK